MMPGPGRHFLADMALFLACLCSPMALDRARTAFLITTPGPCLSDVSFNPPLLPRTAGRRTDRE